MEKHPKFPENKVFKREATSRQTLLLQQGEDVYHENKNDPKTLQYKLNFHARVCQQTIGILIERESSTLENLLQQTRIILNGIMDATGEDNNPQVCIQTKDILESFFDLQD